MTHPNHPNVDQSDRVVPINLRQSGRTPTELLISTRVRKSPFWHLSHEAGCWRATVYNRIYHPRGYVKPEDGGAMVEYEALVNRVTMWNVAVERQIRVKGPDAEAFTDFVITRDATKIEPMHGKYAILCNEKGGILTDPVLLRLGENHFWLSLGDSDILLWAQGVAVNSGLNVKINEPDVSPLQLQGPNSAKIMQNLFGDEILDLKYYWLREIELDNIPLVVSRTGWSSEFGYELFLRDGSKGDLLWEKIMAAGKNFGLKPGHTSSIRRIEGAMLSYHADADIHTNPFEVGLDRLVSFNTDIDYVGKEALKKIKTEGIKRKQIGLILNCDPLKGPNTTFWEIIKDNKIIGKVTSAVYSPRLKKTLH